MRCHAVTFPGVAALMLSLAACTFSQPPAPVLSGIPVAPPPEFAAAPPQTGTSVIVQHGQTLYAVARQQGVPVRSLIDANHLLPPFRIKTGEVLIVPRLSTHVVQPGETLYAVARRYNVEATTLVRLNHLQPPFHIRSGQTLDLPPSPAAVPLPTPTPLPPLPSENVAALPASPVPEEADAVPLEAPPPLPPSPPLIVTPPATPMTSPQVLTPPKAPLPLKPPAVPASIAPSPVPPPSPSLEASSIIPVAPTPARVSAAIAAHAAPVAPIFYWPVRGHIIALFGPGAGGTHNDGINIAAPDGTTVFAAESGSVAYAGDELKGFGNLLLVKHAGGWVSAYAHNEVLLVKRGDHVRRGQPIARVGSTGGVTAPQLHFELRQGTRAMDPLDHLPQLVGGSG